MAQDNCLPGMKIVEVSARERGWGQSTMRALYTESDTFVMQNAYRGGGGGGGETIIFHVRTKWMTPYPV